ncbi:unnamed protein product [Closterium sp. NIES-53]
MELRPSSVPLRVPLLAPPKSSLLDVPDPESDRARAASPTVARLLATAVTDPSFESAAASALVAELLDLAASCRLDNASALVAESVPASLPSVRGECALGTDVLEDRQEDFESLASAVSRFASMLLAPEEYPSLFLRTDTSMPPFYIIVYVDDLVFATADTEALTLVLQRFGFQFSSPQPTPLSTSHSLSAPTLDESVEPSGPYPELVGCFMYLMTCTRPDLAYPLSLLARYVAPGRHRKVHWNAAKRVLRYLCSTLGMGLVLGGRGPVVFTGHADTSWADDSATLRSSQGYTFSLGSGSVSWRSTRSSLVLSSSGEAEIYARAMAAQELRWLTYLLTDLGEQPRSPPVLYVDNKAMIALCQEHRVEHRTKHIALRYFLVRELQQRGQLCLAYVATRANTTDIFTKALPPCNHQRFSTVLGLSCATKASLRVLLFNPEGRPIAFDTWLDDLQLYLLSDSKDSVSLFDHVSGATPAPPATADVSTRSQWLSRDATARLAIRNHLPATECAHFGEHKTAQALYDAVVARYSSPATAAIGRLLLPYLFPELSAFATVADLLTHLRTSDARYCAAVPAEFLPTNQPPMFITLYFIVTRLPDSLRSVRDHFLTLDPTSLTVDLLEQHLLAAETSAVAVGAARGTPRSPFFEGCSPSPLSPSFSSTAAVDVSVPEDVGAASTSAKRRNSKGKGGRGSGGGSGGGGGGSGSGSGGGGRGGGGGGGGGGCGSGGGGGSSGWSGSCGNTGGSPYVIRTGVRAGQTCGKYHTERRCFSRLDDAWHTEFGGDVERPHWAQLLQSGVPIFDLDYDVIISTMNALSFSVEGDCYWCVPLDPGIAATALGASASGTPPSTAPANALHTITLDSGASRCFFRDSTTLTPLPASVPVRLADPSGGPVVASSSTVLPCPAVPSGSLSGLHLPSFSMDLVSTAALRDTMDTTTTPGGQRVSIYTCTWTGRHLATFTRQPGTSLYTLATEPPQVAASAQVTASGQVAASCSCHLLSHQTLLWHHRLGHPSLPRLRGMHSRLLVSGLPWALPPLLPSPAPPCLPCVKGRQRAAPHSSSFPPTTAPLQTLHMDVPSPVARAVRLGPSCPASALLRDFCRGEGITQSFTLPASPQQNGIAEHRIGLVMQVARTSMIHAAAPHFLWPFAVQCAAHQLNLWPRVSFPETSPTLRWTGKVGDASVFRVWGSRAFVRDTSADKLSARAIPYVFLDFVPDAPGWQFYHPDSRRVLPSQDVTFDTWFPSTVAVVSGAAPGAASKGASSGGAEPRGVGSEGAGSGGAEPEGVEPGGAESEGAKSGGAEPEGVEPKGAKSEGAETGGAEPRGAASFGGRAGASGECPCSSYVSGLFSTHIVRVELPELAALQTLELEALAQEALGLQELEMLTLELEVLEAVCGRSQPPLQPASPLPAPSPYTEQSRGLTEHHKPASRPISPVHTARRAPRSHPPPIPGTHVMALHPSSVPLRVPLPAPPESSLPEVPGPESDLAHAASPTVARLLAMAITNPSFESFAASALVAQLLDFPASCRLDYATSLIAKSVSASPPSVKGECALGTDVLEDRQEDFECLAAAVSRFASMLLASEGDPDAPDIPTPRSYAEAIMGPYSSQWKAAMDAEMASWKSTGTYIDKVPPPGANIVDGMWIFRVKRPPGSPPAFKARYVAQGFSQRQGVDYFQTFSPTPKMTTLWVLLHVAAQRDYELHSVDFSTALLQGSLHEEIWLRRSPGFTGTFPASTQWSLRRPVYGLRQAPREWQDTLRTTLAALGFAPSTADPSLFLRTDTSLTPFYVLVYVDEIVFATADTKALTLVKSKLQKRHTCTDLGELRSYLGQQITRDRARRTIILTQSHMVHHVLQRFGFQYSSPQLTPLSTSHSLLAPPSDKSVEPSCPYPELVGCLTFLMTCTRPNLEYPLSLLARYMAPGRHRKGPVVLTSHEDASWVDDSATQRSSQGYTFSLGSGSVSWRSTSSSSVLSSICEAKIYAGAMAAQELRWLTYLLTDLREQPRSPPVLYIDKKAMIALCQEYRLEHRTKHIALRYFLAQDLQQRGQLRLAYVDTRANTADVFTKALPPGDHQRFVTVLGLLAFLCFFS